jgi:hypothetical protein
VNRVNDTPAPAFLFPGTSRGFRFGRNPRRCAQGKIVSGWGWRENRILWYDAPMQVTIHFSDRLSERGINREGVPFAVAPPAGSKAALVKN